MSEGVTSTPTWDARHRLADLASRTRADDELEVTATGDPELFRFRTGDGRVEGFARIVEVDRMRQRSVIIVTGRTSTSSGSASLHLVGRTVEVATDESGASDAPLDPATTAVWLEALSQYADTDSEDAGAAGMDAGGRGREDDGGSRGARQSQDLAPASNTAVARTLQARLVVVSGVAALVLAAVAWWWTRSRGPASDRAGG